MEIFSHVLLWIFAGLCIFVFLLLINLLYEMGRTTKLKKEKLELEIEKLKRENEKAKEG